MAERQSRFVLLVRLPHGHTAEAVAGALAGAVTTLPAQLRRSLTWDQGKEMAEHARFTAATQIPVYFCDPHSPWQRGSNENTNGLLRQYYPRRTDFRLITQSDLDRVAAELNGRLDKPWNGRQHVRYWMRRCDDRLRSSSIGAAIRFGELVTRAASNEPVRGVRPLGGAERLRQLVHRAPEQGAIGQRPGGLVRGQLSARKAQGGWVCGNKPVRAARERPSSRRSSMKPGKTTRKGAFVSHVMAYGHPCG